jgi:hypothetical protein
MSAKLFLISLVAVAGAVLLLAGHTSDTGVTDSAGLSRFSIFQQTYAKRYNSPQEMEYRLGIFLTNCQLVDAHNADASATYTLEINQFADLTDQEFAAQYLGLPKDIGTFASPAEPTVDYLNGTGDEQEVDWVKAGAVHAPKNEGDCQASWAFSSNGALESALAIFKGQKDLDISEQELIDCSGEYGNLGCFGGLTELAFAYIRKRGINDSKDYPYTAKTGVCDYSKSGNGRHKIVDFKKVPRGVKNIVAFTRRQPVAVFMYDVGSLRFYKGGIYNPKGCTGDVNLPVLNVGFKLDTEIPYLYLKNSWGTAWGENGYFRMALRSGAGTCSIGNHDFNFVPIV